ncbi:hypothetical protein B0H19DRAFT_1264286 [Mycena capillaripes]|nr:hypothetical protein B0H19DRAFT_1264286 [Mycena capillaripes]
MSTLSLSPISTRINSSHPVYLIIERLSRLPPTLPLRRAICSTPYPHPPCLKFCQCSEDESSLRFVRGKFPRRSSVKGRVIPRTKVVFIGSACGYCDWVPPPNGGGDSTSPALAIGIGLLGLAVGAVSYFFSRRTTPTLASGESHSSVVDQPIPPDVLAKEEKAKVRRARQEEVLRQIEILQQEMRELTEAEAADSMPSSTQTTKPTRN